MPTSKKPRISSTSSIVVAAITTTTVTDTPVGESEQKQHEPLLPRLPDHLAHLALSSLPPSLLFAVSHSWRRLLYSPSFPPFLSLYAILVGPGSGPIPGPSPNPIQLSSFDPASSTWAPVPNPPTLPHLLLTHPSFLSRHLPIQSATVSGQLILVSATTRHLSPAISQPLIFNPLTSSWHVGPAFPSPRRWCAVGSAAGDLYVASGVGSDYTSDVARSAHKWTLNQAGSGWEQLNPLKDGRFSREPIEMVGSSGKLCMVNCRGPGAKEGICFDIGSGRWQEMPIGLLMGWTGPAAAVGEDGDVFVVDEVSGVLKRYEWEGDTWTVVMEWEGLKGAVAMAGGGGRVCVACGAGEKVVVVDVKRAGRVWTVEPPEGTRVVAMHVMPRMSRGES